MIIMREFMLVSSSITEDIVEVLTNADAGLQIFKRNEFWLISIFLCRLFIRLVFQPLWPPVGFAYKTTLKN